MQIINSAARLITINHNGKSYRLLPAGDSVEAPESIKDSKFFTLLLREGSVRITDDTVDPLQTLRDEAEELGVSVDKRWGEAKLRQSIEDAKAE